MSEEEVISETEASEVSVDWEKGRQRHLSVSASVWSEEPLQRELQHRGGACGNHTPKMASQRHTEPR